jgi:CBS domain-containing protein
MDLRKRPVSDIMRRQVVTVTADEKLDLTQDLMSLGRVRHLPVIDAEQRVIGIVSHRDLLAAAMSKVLDFDPQSRRTFLRSIEIREVMATDVATVQRETPLEEVARILVDRKIGCLPVVTPRGKLLGLITESDLIAAALIDEAGSESDAKDDEESGGIDLGEWVHHELTELRRMRDELRVQTHLGKAEVRDRWEALERTLNALESKVKHATRVAEEPLRQAERDLRKLAADLRDGYRRIRDAI